MNNITNIRNKGLMMLHQDINHEITQLKRYNQPITYEL